uniref:Purinergic receptor P2X 7 n=1 Tax=Terrapene triunguis TaxID=2587831 RepID=A0A674JQ16_9SAUR
MELRLQSHLDTFRSLVLQFLGARSCRGGVSGYFFLSKQLHLYLDITYVLVTDKRYQKKDSVISSIHTKVKGVVQTDSRIWDTAEYTIPMQGIDSFFVITNIIMTENQFQNVCPEVTTGRCVKYNATIKTCEVSAWCPVESMKGAPV